MADINDLRSALAGNSGASVGIPFVLAIRSFINWPPDAFSIEVEDRYIQTLYWVQGDGVGYLISEGNHDDPSLKGEFRSVADIENVTLSAKIVDSGLGPGEVRRAVEVQFKSGEVIKIDVAACTNQHQRDLANTFINTVLSAVAGEDLEAVVE
ncbi:hypothetical protein [Mycolicibacterium sphagni]|uniref:Uncharacterized protein n=1 Tax=Mycolicibacterium sphagni TaxID=1786 RepID=A0A255DIH0_9MYCO|nr:hypothetical protein [Mycolicibacterium sphagni]OYN78900.1 hypothetical protein CG716_13610 [Mycolicibacterium sphagni]